MNQERIIPTTVLHLSNVTKRKWYSNVHKGSSRSSAFVAGDVDIFLQPSPLTRSLACHLAQHGVEEVLLKHISEFIRGFWLCEGDLERILTELCGNLIISTFKNIGSGQDGQELVNFTPTKSSGEFPQSPRQRESVCDCLYSRGIGSRNTDRYSWN